MIHGKRGNGRTAGKFTEELARRVTREPRIPFVFREGGRAAVPRHFALGEPCRGRRARTTFRVRSREKHVFKKRKKEKKTNKPCPSKISRKEFARRAIRLAEGIARSFFIRGFVAAITAAELRTANCLHLGRGRLIIIRATRLIYTRGERYENTTRGTGVVAN